MRQDITFLVESDERAELIARATKAIVADRGYTAYGRRGQSNDFSVHPDANLKRVLELVQNDPVVRGAITTLIDRTLEPGYSFYGKDKKSRQQSAVDKMEELRFNRLLRPLLQHLFGYSNAFVEIVKDANEATELHTLDPRYMEPMVDQHGVVTQYVMKVADEVVTWQPDEVVHLKTTPLAQTVWGDVEVKALWTACALKYHIKKLFLYQYESNSFRPLLNINNASDDQIKRFLAFLQEAKQDIKRLVPIEGEIEAVFLDQMQDYSKVKELLTYLDYEILNILQVPPIAVGLPDNSNRSNSDAQERALATRIRSIHRLLEDIISNDLLPQIGFSKVYLKFGPIDERNETTVMEIAERMKNMGFKQELIKEYLESKGWDFPEGDIFEEVQVDPVTGQPMDGSKKSDDMFPSRKGKLPGVANKKIGTGEQGTTRPDQLVKRTDPRKHWSYDVLVNDDAVV